MKRTGIMELRLHYGETPRWLFERMVRLGRGIVKVMASEFGRTEILRRLSDPLFFQALSNTLGFDWDSSGSTTVTCGVLREVFNLEDVGIKMAGGKGEASKRTLEELDLLAEELGISTWKTERLKYASRMTAKVDNAAIQAGYQLYHHAFFLSEDGEWVVVQQGLNPEAKAARRYHWLSENVRSFVEEPHTGIIGDKLHRRVLDLTAKESEEARKTSVDLVADNPYRTVMPYLASKPGQSSIARWVSGQKVEGYTIIPVRVNWEALKRACEFKPKNYEELLAVKGIGPSTVRGLALVAELIYGSKVSWKDPLKFSFAFGGKDGVPFPVKRRAMERAAEYLRQALEAAELGSREKLEALKRLRKFVPPDVEQC
ncbi:DUF763 domain-containing protein [Candidatus Bathyarchaeota archaeon]|nr:MAG: DUF763 domain-containing protein [Candidatus Bathyarchaeota archaeon]